MQERWNPRHVTSLSHLRRLGPDESPPVSQWTRTGSSRTTPLSRIVQHPPLTAHRLCESDPRGRIRRHRKRSMIRRRGPLGSGTMSPNHCWACAPRVRYRRIPPDSGGSRARWARKLWSVQSRSPNACPQAKPPRIATAPKRQANWNTRGGC